MLASDLLHKRHLASGALSLVSEPADIAHVLALGAQLTRLGMADVVRRPAEFFHYTTLGSFFKIISSDVLRATNAEQCNDLKEVIHGRERISECLTQQVFRGFPRSLRWHFFTSAQEVVAPRPPSYFITCFSSRPDGQIEWVQYADHGRGVAIVLDRSKVSRFATANAPEVPALKPITYHAEPQRSQLNVACDIVYTTLTRRLAGDTPSTRHDGFVRTLLSMLCGHLMYQAMAFKHDFWKDEQEWRTVVALQRDPSDTNAVHEDPRGRKYMELRCDEGALPITRVIVGPAVTPEQEIDVRRALTAHGYHVPVLRSDVPLR